MNKIKIYFLVILAILSSIASAGTFTKIDYTEEEIKKYKIEGVSFFAFEGEIVDGDEKKLEKIITQYKKNIFILIDSNGGSFFTGLLLGELTSKHKVNIIVGKAYSAAGFWALADTTRAYLDEKSELGLHLPYNDKAEKTEESMFIGALMYEYLLVTCELKDPLSLLAELSKIRKDHGTQGMLVYTKKEKESKIVKP